MASINISRKSVVFDPDLDSYRMVLEVTSAQNINSKIFVKQRIRNFFKNTSEDVFAAVATPVQLEDFDEDSPKEGDSYFRTDKIDVTGRTMTYLDWFVEQLLADVQKLVIDVGLLATLEDQGTYTITDSSVTLS